MGQGAFVGPGPEGGSLLPTLPRRALVAALRDHGTVGVREDCRHYIQRTTQGGELLRRCRLGAAQEGPFTCPDGCLFFEERVLSTAGWTAGTGEAMSNTAWGLAQLPPTPRSKPPKGDKKKGRKPRRAGS